MDLNKLKGHIPDNVIAQLPDPIAKFELNTPLRLAHFLAQAGHESGGFKAVNENLNYGDGPEASGDGYKFRGRGYIQLTGKDNYAAFDKVVSENLLETPDLVATKYPLLSAAWFFHKNGLHKIADQGATDAVVTSVTKRVNGGTIGLPDRIKHFKEYYHLLA